MDKAIIFLRSVSDMAEVPAKNIVKQEIINSKAKVNLDEVIVDWNRINRKTPAVTRVDECTRADTGVGAAIAAGSHLEKGIWALFVIAASIINSAIEIFNLFIQKLIINQCPWDKVRAIAIIIITSPTRFLRTVNIPAASDLAFW